MRRGEPHKEACMDINKWSMRTLAPGINNKKVKEETSSRKDVSFPGGNK